MTLPMVKVMKDAVKFIKPVFIGTGTSKTDERLLTLNFCLMTG